VWVELPLWQFSTTTRTGPAEWFAEAVATFGLGLTIFGSLAHAAFSCPLWGGPVHHLGLLVHSFHLVRQSGRHDRAFPVRYVRRPSLRSEYSGLSWRSSSALRWRSS
jgi:hypothetical protein